MTDSTEFEDPVTIEHTKAAIMALVDGRDGGVPGDELRADAGVVVDWMRDALIDGALLGGLMAGLYALRVVDGDVRWYRRGAAPA